MKKSFFLPLIMAFAAYLVLPLPGLSAPLPQRIEQKRGQIEEAKQKEGVLTTDIAQFSTRIESLQGEISATQSRLDRAQASLDRQKAELLEVRDQDREVTDEVRGLRDRARNQAVELAELEQREQLAAERILAERDQIAQAQSQLVASRDQLASARADKSGALAQVRDSRLRAQEDLAALEAEQDRVEAALQSASAPSAGPIRQGSGQLIWPVNGTFTSPFGMRWGRLHAGIDIAAPEGTPIRAADSGRVVLAGWTGGYGNYTCIQHTGSLSTCYAHQSRLGTSTGANVSQGQVMGYVGNTGHSFGAHLHFETRINGSPVDPMGYL